MLYQSGANKPLKGAALLGAKLSTLHGPTMMQGQHATGHDAKNLCRRYALVHNKGMIHATQDAVY